MSLAAGTRIGPYEIVSALGVGGMGEVYRARDSKLNRDVAVKILPPSLGADPDRLARFRREAQVLASLNHPNIAHIHGFEDSGQTHALVMELVEGQTLAERIAGGAGGPEGHALRLEDALPIAKQIAEALEAAHEQGIIHRDLKPANIKVRDDGMVKVLDFGLAKALDPASGLASAPSAAAMNSPTLTARGTQMGMILGTAAYMSPEQAKGRSVDRRADIWAFGVVLYEMLTGRRGYEADGVSETLAAVLTREVDWTQMPADTPARLNALVRDCLVRDPKHRLRDIGEARRVLERIIDGAPDAGAPAGPAAPLAPTWRRALPWALAAAAIIVAVLAALRPFSTPASAPLVTRSLVTLNELSLWTTVSRDGTRIAYTTSEDVTTRLTLRMTDQFEGKTIPGSEGGAVPVFSPDGEWLAYTWRAGGTYTIKKIAVTGGTAIPLADGSFAQGGAWGTDDTIVFSGATGLMRLPAHGGTPEPLTTIDGAKGESAHVRPQFLPDGRHLLFTVMSTASSDNFQFAVLDLTNGTRRDLVKGGGNGRYLNSGHLTYVRGNTLFALPFDVASMTAIGKEVSLVEGVATRGSGGTADYAVSDDGLLVYFERWSGAPGSTLAWADRTGKQTAVPGEPTREWGTGRLSPNGRFIANSIDGGLTRDIWVFDVQRGTANRLTFEGKNDRPVWTKDSKYLYYGSNYDTDPGISKVAADGSGKPVLVLKTDPFVHPSSLAPDDRTLLVTQAGRIMIVTIPATGEASAPKPLHETSSRERDGQVSPDGKWVAYVSEESGPSEVYVHPFPNGGARERISTAGGQTPRWARNGRELFYWTFRPDMALKSVSVQTGASLQPGTPTELFPLLAGSTWDVTPDPNRFLIELSQVQDSKLVIITNWFEELRRRAPAKR